MKYIKKYEELKDIHTIKEIDISFKSLTELKDLSKYINLIKLNCHDNELISLPELPDSLEYLYCENNNLPYNNRIEYDEWKKDPEAWEANIASNKYNL